MKATTRAGTLLFAFATALLRSAAALATQPSAVPGDADAVEKAEVLERWGDRRGALALLRARVDADKTDVRARVVLGRMLLSEGRDDEARAELSAVPEGSEERAEALRGLIELELRARQLARAEALATEGLTAAPDDADLRVSRARARLALGRLDEASADVDRVLAKTPSDANARALRERIATAGRLRRRVIDAAEEARAAEGLGVAKAVASGAVALVELAVVSTTTVSRPKAAGGHGDLLAEARALSARGDRPAALALLRYHLEASPNDTDARTLYGTILSWDGRYSEARDELARVDAAVPGHGDAARAAIRVELWSDHPGQAEALASKAIAREGETPDLLLLRAQALLASDDPKRARRDVERALQLEPSNAEARRLSSRAKLESMVWTAGSLYSVDAFSDGRTPWHEVGIQGKRTLSWGSMLARAYNAWRFDTNDQQFEVEAFPTFRPGTYGDVAVAIAPRGELYPVYRLQLDLYQSLPIGFELSAGYRLMRFGDHVNMIVLTANKYWSAWLFTVRSFITPGVAGTSVSVSGAVRRYLLDGALYVGLRYGYGLSKQELRTVNDVALLGSNTIGMESSFPLGDRVELAVRGAVSQEARPNRPDLWQYGLTSSLSLRF
jgi:YaiO family outer membrane protein